MFLSRRLHSPFDRILHTDDPDDLYIILFVMAVSYAHLIIYSLLSPTATDQHTIASHGDALAPRFFL